MSEPEITRHTPSSVELSAALAARLCHDFISPASAIVSGMDLLEDPESQDMREEALSLIGASAKKLAAHLQFARVAFGASAAADNFDPQALKALADGVFAHVRADLDWNAPMPSVNKPAARSMLNLAQIGAGMLPTGGTAKLRAEETGSGLLIEISAEGPKVKLREEIADGLAGKGLGDGLAGHWVQAYYLHRLVDEAGGTVEFSAEPEKASVRVRLPA